tara:strand:+ start:1065 stop:2633 length:1569 start_codon:yes stop_codon:yes gene_type:complete
MSHHYNSGNSLHQKILKGVDALADNVASTLGPRGRNVILHAKDKAPIITKDGVTVANFVEFEDPFENVAAQVLKQAAAQTNAMAGDGTTTSTVLARAIVTQAQKYLTAGSSPVELKRGIDKAVEAIVASLEEQAIPISSEEDVAHIATISANGDSSIGKLIATAVDLAGKDGAITIEEARSVETSLDIVEGFRFDSGYISPTFINNERQGSVKYSDPLVLVTDAQIETVDELMPMLEIVARESRPFVIVAENVEGQALAALIMNSVRGTLKVAAVKAPRYGQERKNILRDLALSIGATYVSRTSGIKLKDVQLEHLGSAKTITILKSATTIVDGAGDAHAVEGAIEVLKVEVEQTESLRECELIQERITRLASGIAIIRVGAPTEIEMMEKKHRVEDALEAVRSAQQEGIVPGGGVTLLKLAAALEIVGENDDQNFGINIVKEAAKEPIRQMALNAGGSPDLIVDTVLRSKENFGYNFASGQVVDLFEKGIVDPAKVVRCALQNAASASSTLLTTNYCIIER